MKLKELLAVMDQTTGATIHIAAQPDDHYLYLSDIESEYYEYDVVLLDRSYVPSLTEWYIYIEKGGVLE